jgi:hypothetical protein
MTRRDACNLIRAVTAALRCRRCEVSLDSDAGLGERSRHRFLHKDVELSGARPGGSLVRQPEVILPMAKLADMNGELSASA